MTPFRTTVTANRSPVMTMSLIVVNIAVFFIHRGLSPREAMGFLYTYALVPAIYTHPGVARDLGLEPTNLLPLLSNTFLHGGYLHLIVNLWTLWLLGLPVEDRLGPWRFLLLYLASGLAGSVLHLAFNLNSVVPTLGASGAVAGILGAFTAFFPRAKVALVQPIFFLPLVFHLPAVIFTALWFALQLAQGVLATNAAPTAAGIAWWAHIGGFAAGLAIVWKKRRPERSGGPWNR